MNDSGYIRWFRDIRLADVPQVGGKTASLGELYSELSPQGVKVSDGFALTAKAYRDALTKAGAWEKLEGLLAGVDKRRISDLAKRAAAARAIVYAATDQDDLRHQVMEAYRQLEQEYGTNVAVAVRSSATLPQHSRPARSHDCVPALFRLSVHGSRDILSHR